MQGLAISVFGITTAKITLFFSKKIFFLPKLFRIIAVCNYVKHNF